MLLKKTISINIIRYRNKNSMILYNTYKSLSQKIFKYFLVGIRIRQLVAPSLGLTLT